MVVLDVDPDGAKNHEVTRLVMVNSATTAVVDVNRKLLVKSSSPLIDRPCRVRFYDLKESLSSSIGGVLLRGTIAARDASTLLVSCGGHLFVSVTNAASVCSQVHLRDLFVHVSI